jgi:sulfur-oxidizing protein SoxY
MKNDTLLSRLDRRQFALGAAALVTLAALPAVPALAQDQLKPWEELVKKLVGDAKPIEGKVLIDMAEIAENGNTVPFTVSVDSPMTDADHVKAIHLISTANPQPNVVTFRFKPITGAAKAESRMRLIGTQDVIAIAEVSDGKILMGRRSVKVTVGGCGG